MEDTEVVIRNWRMMKGIPSGMLCWFDPKCESVKLFRLPTPVSEEVSIGLEVEGVDKWGESGYLDKVGSVSELEVEADRPLGEQAWFSFTGGENDPQV